MVWCYTIPEPWRGHCSQYRPHAKPREQQHFFAVMGIMRGREHCPKTKCWVETPYTTLYMVICNIQHRFVTISINGKWTIVSSDLNIRKFLPTSSTYTALAPAFKFKLFEIFAMVESIYILISAYYQETVLHYLCGWYGICWTSENDLLNPRGS